MTHSGSTAHPDIAAQQCGFHKKKKKKGMAVASSHKSKGKRTGKAQELFTVVILSSSPTLIIQTIHTDSI